MQPLIQAGEQLGGDRAEDTYAVRVSDFEVQPIIIAH